MRHLILASAVAILLCSGCTSTQEHTVATPQDVGAGSVELRAAGNRSYVWQDRTYSLQDLNAALLVHDQTQPVERISLLDSDHPTTVADVIDIAVLAKELGAVPYIENDGKLQPITLELKE